MSQGHIVLLVLIINTIIAIFYIVVKLCKKEKSKAWIVGILIFLCPVTAPVYLVLSELVYATLFRHKEGEFSIDELSFHKDRVEIILPADLEQGMNKIPIGDALIASNKQNARRVMLDVLKDRYEPFLDVIAKAVEHNDSEVSHYAASAISDIIAEFKNNEKKLHNTYESETENPKEAAIEYGGYLYNFLMKHILPEAEQKRFLLRYVDLMEDMYKKKEDSFVDENYLKIMGLLLEEQDYEEARKWAERKTALINEVEDLNVYKALMKYYYTIENRAMFFQILNQLKKSDVMLDGETLAQIRFWNNR